MNKVLFKAGRDVVSSALLFVKTHITDATLDCVSNKRVTINVFGWEVGYKKGVR